MKLESSVEEYDFGIWIASNLSSQCSKATTKAMKAFGMRRRTFRCLSKEEFQLLYKTYVRLDLEYCVQVWTQYYRKDRMLGEGSAQSHKDGEGYEESTV